jgi:hypothetical protein
MGMYDSIYLDYVCPYCNQKSEMEFQTKDLDCLCDVFHVGDFVGNRLNYLNVIAGCHSPECQGRADKHGCSFQGSPTGFGALFEAKLKVIGGAIANEVYDVITDPVYTDEYLETIRGQWEHCYRPRKNDYMSDLWLKVKR